MPYLCFRELAKELSRFAPSLKVHTHYSSSRIKDEAFTKFIEIEQPKVVLSTYGTISQDIEFLQYIDWATVTLDEAQNIKICKLFNLVQSVSYKENTILP